MLVLQSFETADGTIYFFLFSENASMMWRKFIPPDRADYIPFTLFALLFPTSIGIQFTLLLPKIFDGMTLSVSYAVVSYLSLAIYFCWFKLITTDSTTRGVMLPFVQKPEWKFCWICNQNSPPRSYHCQRYL